MSKVFNMVGGGGGPAASIFVTGLSETDTVTATNGSKTLTGKWTQKPNPDYITLPSEYTQLEYIQSTGTQYIDLGYSTSNAATLAKTSFEVTCAYYDIQAGSTAELIHGNGNSYLGFIAGKFYASWGRSAGILTDSNIVPDSLMHTWLADTDEKVIKFDDTIVEINVNFNGSANKYGALYLFGIEPSKLNSCRIASAKLKYNGEYVRNLIPVRRNSDSVLGFYDLVNDVFYTNAGTGTFIAGSEVPQTIDCYMLSPIRELGTWTVMATDGTDTYTQDVLVDVITEYEIEITKKHYLYRDGDECESVTGGWSNYSDTSSVTISALVKNDDNLYSACEIIYSLAGTVNLIDLTNYKTLYADVKPGTGQNSYGWVGSSIVTQKEWLQEKDNPPAFALWQQGSNAVDRTVYSIDVSGLTGLYYITIITYAKSFNIYNVWLEE